MARSSLCSDACYKPYAVLESERDDAGPGYSAIHGRDNPMLSMART